MSTAATAGGAGENRPEVPELMLASSSPRRRQLLQRSGLRYRVVPPVADDSDVPGSIGGSIADRTVALAWLKAASTLEVLGDADRQGGLLLAADTLVADGDRPLGKPASERDAERTLRALAGRTHLVWTGHALVAPGSGWRRLWADAAAVRFGPIDESHLRRHLASGAWRGRAGGYSLDEVTRAGWDVECDGDPDVVLGLSTAKVREALIAFASRGAGLG